ncbi:alpha/beta hydrolase [Patescibacteria group bacterium]|nr:alpha/beta hydrolase [Patescibacteria group bacterium]
MKKQNFKKIQNKNHPVYYQFIDNGSEETVVFLHGLFSTSSIFRHCLKAIKKNIILIELRGIVYSKCKSPYLNNYVEDIRLILEKEKITKKVILVGYSLGCSIANEFAEHHSEMADKIIMLAPVNKTFRQIGKRNLIKTLITGLGKSFFRKWKEYLRLERRQPFYKLFSLFNFKLLKDIYREMIFTQKCKIVILNGKLDTFFNYQDSNLKLPNIVHEQIENLDHFLFIRTQRAKTIAEQLKIHLTTV